MEKASINTNHNHLKILNLCKIKICNHLVFHILSIQKKHENKFYKIIILIFKNYLN